MINENEFEAAKLVTKVINLVDDELKYSDDVFNIAYGVDKNFIFGTGVSIASILMHNNNMDFHFHVFTDFFDREQESLFSQLAKQYNTKITIYLLKCEELNNLPTNHCWSYAIYFRLIIVDYLKNKIKNVLYLDSDAFCKGSMVDLKKLNFEDDIILYAVHDSEAKDKSKLKIDTNKYFNSGFLYINLMKYNKCKITKKVFKELNEKNILNYPDQDALNICLNKNVKLIDVKYNTFFPIDALIRTKSKNKFFIYHQSVIVHYVGLSKPWHDWTTDYIETEIFRLAKSKSPWSSYQLLKPKSYKEISRKSRHLKYQKKYLKSYVFYIKYILAKISRKK
ncbi:MULTISPECIES: glycosyltransferase [Arsenophonus]|uniref:glycosyltransferase n=1 Tax=Arsenophonus TaxID=637 RepID=UPI003879FD7E